MTPPDDLIAVEMAEHPNDLAGIASTSKAPAAAQPVQPSRPISLADSAKRSRLTPAAKKREEMTEKMFQLIEKEVKKDVEEVEDEYEFAFISLAKRANKYLTMIRRRICCRMLKKQYARPSTRLVVEKKDHSLQQFLLLVLVNYNHQEIVLQPPPPLVNASTLQLTMNNDFFNQGQVTFDPKTGQQIYQF